MVRLLAFALYAPASDDHGALEFAKSLWDTDEPDAVAARTSPARSCTGSTSASPTIGGLMRASGRAERVSVYSYSASTPIWWSGIAIEAHARRALEVWQIDAAQSQALAGLGATHDAAAGHACRTRTVWIGDGAAFGRDHAAAPASVSAEI